MDKNIPGRACRRVLAGPNRITLDPANPSRTCRSFTWDLLCRCPVLTFPSTPLGQTGTPDEKHRLYDELLSAAPDVFLRVCQHAFGNYVVQKFFSCGSPKQQAALAAALVPFVPPLSLHAFGCRVVQRVRCVFRGLPQRPSLWHLCQAFEVLTGDAQLSLLNGITASSVLSYSLHQHANHVIQKIIATVPASRLQFIVDACVAELPTLCCHQYACRVVQRLLEFATPEQAQPILNSVFGLIPTLVLDQFGNYVLQHILEHGRVESRCVSLLAPFCVCFQLTV